MKHVIILLIRLYQRLISAILPFNHCRFYPSCSEYSIEAFEEHSIMKGLWLTVNRILKCHPFSKFSGYDPVP